MELANQDQVAGLDPKFGAMAGTCATSLPPSEEHRRPDAMALRGRMNLALLGRAGVPGFAYKILRLMSSPLDRRIWQPRYARHDHWEPSTQA